MVTLLDVIMIAVYWILLALINCVAVTFKFIMGAEYYVTVASYFIMASLELVLVAY
jgi:hypothetical protein